MADYKKINVYLGSFIFVIVGYLISEILEDFLLNNLPSQPILEIFTPMRIWYICSAIVWFVVCFICYWGSTRFIDSGEDVGMLSLFFLINLPGLHRGVINSQRLHQTQPTISFL